MVVSQLVIVKWPRWPPCSKMLKASKDLLPDLLGHCLATGYLASGTVVLQNLYKICSWVDLNLILWQGQFWFHMHFLIGKGEMTILTIFCCFCTLEYINEVNCITYGC